MAKRKDNISKVQKYVNKKYEVLQALMKDLDQKYTLRIGVIGSKAYEKQPHSDLTMGQLAAIHEYGATIDVTPKMRNYLHRIGIHLKPTTYSIIIPARSFLRATLLSEAGRHELMKYAGLAGVEKEDLKILKDHILNTLDTNPHFMEKFVKELGLKAQEMVQEAFETGGYSYHWAPISEVTKKNRQGNADSPPLTDLGDLRNSISFEVRKIK